MGKKAAHALVCDNGLSFFCIVGVHGEGVSFSKRMILMNGFSTFLALLLLPRVRLGTKQNNILEQRHDVCIPYYRVNG
jgi:hypothetical protein